MTGDWILPLLRLAFLAGLLVLVVQLVRAVIASRALLPGPSPAPLVFAVQDPERLRGQRFVVTSGALIGRGPDCAICLSDEYVSSNHARLIEREGAFWVEDLHSANGTLLNGQRLRHAGPLRVGDRLAVGGVVLILREAS